MLPPDDQTDEPTPRPEPDPASGDQPRHPFTYRAPAEKPPELPPLTVDDVADEARRNDKVLVGAAGLMAIVFACTTIADSRSLVHVATGRYLANQGVLPPASDVFSATGTDRPWVNPHWLYDLAVAGLHAVGGFTALTVLQVVAAVAVIVLILACRHSGVSSWWAASVAVLAALAATPQFTARSEVVTLVGLAATLWLLTRYRQELDRRAVWWFVLLFLVWANLDPRMFFGLAALLLYGIGELIGMFAGRPGFDDGSRRSRYWMAVGASVAASFVNPFTWRAPLGALRLYGQVDPAYRQYYENDTSWTVLPHLPLWSFPRGAMFDTVLLVGLLLAVVAAVTLLLNRRRLDFGDLALWLGFVAFGVFAGREWPAASIVFAVLAIQNAESWYRGTFRQTYGTDRAELLFSRGGRAVTVIAFATLAALWMLGRIVADDGRRPGLGLDASLSNQVASLSEVLVDSYHDKVFNFHAAQGDVLIWVGKRPFIDHRLALYSADASTDGDLIALHDNVRNALRAAASEVEWGRPDIWKPALERFGIVQAVPRLTLPNPDYVSYFDLLRSRDWMLIKLGAAGALFCRRDTGDALVDDYLAAHRSHLTEAAFREPVPKLANQAAWPLTSTWSDRLTRPEPPSNELARGIHCLQHLELVEAQQMQLTPQTVFAFAYLAMRDFYMTLAEDPQSVAAYRGLGRVYEILYGQESSGAGGPMQRRLYQALGAYGQARTIAPDDPGTHERLIPLYLAFNKAELAVQARDEYERLTGSEPPKPANEDAAEQWDEMWKQVREQVRTVKTQAATYLKEEQPRLDVILFAWQNGCTLEALELMDADPTLVEDNAQVRRLRAVLLLEAARPREAFEELVEIEPAASSQGLPGFREPLAFASLALPDFERAEALWRDEAAEAGRTQLISAMNTVPLAGPLHGNRDHVFPTWQVEQTGRTFDQAQQIAQAEINAALCELESGRLEEAEASLSGMLARQPLTRFTPLAGFYLEQLRGEGVTLTIDLGEDDAMFDEVEARLNAPIVAEQLKAAGPVTAEKP